MRKLTPLLPRLAALALLNASLAAIAQQVQELPAPAAPPQQQTTPPVTNIGPLETLQLSTRIVVLDVVVKDKKGNIVDDLTRNDFTIFEGGQPQRTRSFEAPEKHFMPADITINSTADLDKKDPDAAIDIVVLDEFNTRFTDMDFARYSIKQYIGAQPPKLGQPTELIAISHNKFSVLHDYTQDGAAIIASLNKHLSIYPWELENNRTGTGTIERLALSLGALEQVAQATKGHPGHKNVIWVGHGFPGINTIDLTVEQTAGITGAIQRALDMLRDARITLYTIDPTATATMTVALDEDNADAVAEDATGQDPFVSNVSFTALASATGGKAYFSRNDVDREIGTSVRDGGNFYTLSYSPTTAGDASALYRHIFVKINRPGLRATTRDGYYSEPAAPNKAMAHNQYMFDLTSAGNTTLAYDGLQIEAKPVPGAAGNFLVAISPKGLSYKNLDNGDRTAEVVIETVSFGAKDKYLGRTLDGITIKSVLPAAGQPANEVTRVKTTAKMPPGTQRVRFVVRDSASGRMGTADYKLP